MKTKENVKSEEEKEAERSMRYIINKNINKEKIPLLTKDTTKEKYDLTKFSGKKIPILFNSMYENIINNEEYKKYPAYIISEIFSLDQDYILKHMKIEKEKLKKQKLKEKGYEVDFICDLDGVKIEIEMNNCEESKVAERNIAYASKIFYNSAKRGDGYDYSMVILVNLNNFVYEKNNKTIQIFQFFDDDGELLDDKFKIVNIYLPKIREKYYNKKELSNLEKMLLVMIEENENTLKDLTKGDGSNIMKEFITDAKDMSEDDEIIGLYNKELEDLALQKLLQKKEYEKGIEKGIKKGKKEGLEEGKNEVAKNLLKNKVPINIIAISTGLSEEKINKLK